jgi:ABC-type dipeptide/oligopeptide/nickel transport system permease component
MTAYVVRRLVGAAFVFWLALTLAFAAMQLAPGDPAQALLAASGASAEQIAQRRAELGLDDPPLTQYGRYLLGLAQGDLGRSWLHGRPVGEMIAEQVPPTVALALSGMGLGTAIGLVLGAIGAFRRGTWLDTATTAVAIVGLSTPTYWTGLLAILVFALGWPRLPASGSGSLRHLLLPTVVLSVAVSGSVARMVRARASEVISEQHVTYARALGLPTGRILLSHVLRPAIAPTVSVVALQLGFLLGGAVVTETVFARRGLGRLALEAVMWRDLPTIRGIIVVSAAAYLTVNLAADLIHAWLDPRVREALK